MNRSAIGPTVLPQTQVTPIPTPAVRFIPLAETVPPLPTDPTTNTERQSFFDSLRAVTPALIITGIAIGIASGIGTTVGSALGSVVTKRFQGSSKNRKRGR